MAEYDNTDKGALFKNDEKDEKHPNWPDYKGSINIDGTEFWLSAWIKKSKAGKSYMSLQIGDEKEARQPAKPAGRGGRDFNDDAADIPF